MDTNQSTQALVNAKEAGPITVVSIWIRTLTDFDAINAVANEIRAVSRRAEHPVILLDFRRVEHISLDFLDAMNDVKEEIVSRDGAIYCCSLRPEMRSILKVLDADVSYAGNNAKHALARCIANLEKKKVNSACGLH